MFNLNLVEMIFLTAKHGNQEDFEKHLQEYRELSSPEQSVKDFTFGLHGQSLIRAAIKGDNAVIFDEALRLEGLQLDSVIELDSDESDLEASDGEDDAAVIEGPCGTLKHFTSRPRRFSHDAEEEDLSIGERMMRRAQHQGDRLPRSFTLGTGFLRKAIDESATSIVEHLILDLGVRDDLPDGYQSALHLAVEGRHENLLELLLQRAGSRIDGFDHHHLTPLHCAIKLGHLKIAAKLLRLGASVSLADSHGRNAVFFAAAAPWSTISLLRLMYDMSQAEGFDLRHLILAPEIGTMNTALHVCKTKEAFNFFAQSLRMDMTKPLNRYGQSPLQSCSHLQEIRQRHLVY